MQFDTSPKGRIVAVTAADNADLTKGTCAALLVGTAGAADIVDEFGNAASAVPLQQGYNPIRVRRIKSTNLTASNIWALYDSNV